MHVGNVMSFEAAALGGVGSITSVDMTAFDDPVANKRLSITGGGPGGGGRLPNFMPAIFPTGSLPRVEAIATVVANHGLATALRSGSIFQAMRPVPGFQIPELQTVFAVPAAMSDVVRAMEDINSWNRWMPRFDESASRPAGPGRGNYQRAVMSAVGLKIVYQVRVLSQPLDGGHQIHWSIDEDGFRKGMLQVGLAVNNGSFTAMPFPEDRQQTLVVYSIHTQPKPLVPGTAHKIQETTLKEFPEFPQSLSLRARHPGWTRQHPRATLDRTFRMVDVAGR